MCIDLHYSHCGDINLCTQSYCGDETPECKSVNFRVKTWVKVRVRVRISLQEMSVRVRVMETRCVWVCVCLNEKREWETADLDEDGGSRSSADARMQCGNVTCRLIQLSEMLSGVSAPINMR